MRRGPGATPPSPPRSRTGATRPWPSCARRRRLFQVDFYGDTPQDTFGIAARAYSLGKLALMDGDLAEAAEEIHPLWRGFAVVELEADIPCQKLLPL